LKPPPKHPNSIQNGVPEDLEDAFNDNEESNTFVKLPSRKDGPNGREKSKELMLPTSLWIRVQTGFHCNKPKMPLRCKICGSRLRPLSK